MKGFRGEAYPGFLHLALTPTPCSSPGPRQETGARSFKAATLLPQPPAGAGSRRGPLSAELLPSDNSGSLDTWESLHTEGFLGTLVC